MHTSRSRSYHTGIDIKPTGIQIIAGIALVGFMAYSLTKFLETKYDPETPISSQKIYQKISPDDQRILQRLVPVLNKGLVREERFFEKHVNYVMQKTSQKEFEQVALQAISVDKQCAEQHKHVVSVEKPYLDWNPIDITCN